MTHFFPFLRIWQTMPRPAAAPENNKSQDSVVKWAASCDVNFGKGWCPARPYLISLVHMQRCAWQIGPIYMKMIWDVSHESEL